MSEVVNTFLVDDHRISGITDQTNVAVKKGPATTTIQKYKQTSNTSSNVMFQVAVPTENILCDRAIRINTKLRCTITLTSALAEAQVITVVPSSFPLNTGLQSASARINNAKLEVSSSDVVETIKKQYNQRYLSKYCQMTPSLVDTYFGIIDDASEDIFPNSYMNGAKYGGNDDTSGRADCKISFLAYNALGAAIAPVDGTVTIPVANSNGAYIDVTIDVSENILGLPTFEIKSEESAYLGINNLELNLQLNDCKRSVYMGMTENNRAVTYSIAPGIKFPANVSSNFLSDESYIVMNYLSLHPSDYAKMSVKNVIPFNEFTSYRQLSTRTSDSVGSLGSFSVQGNTISMRQIPDKIFVYVGVPPERRPIGVSNHLNFPITGLKIDFNNRSNLMAELDQRDLYALSRRNGSNQTYPEFSGTVRGQDGQIYCSLGSVIVIDPTRDLSLDDYLAAGSLGTFSFQITANCDNYSVIRPNRTTLAAQSDVQLNVIASYAGVLVTQQGVSVSQSGLLTKSLVLDTKEKGTAVGDYEAVAELQGGNVGRSLSGLGDALKKRGVGMVKSQAKSAIDSAVNGLGGHYNYSAGSRLSKYT